MTFKNVFFLSAALFLSRPLSAQIYAGGDTLYGNEWIQFDQTYFKIKIAADGVYRIPQSLLAAKGLGNTPGNEFRLFREGRQVGIFTSTEGVFSADDFIEFPGFKNRGEADRYLFENPADGQLNPDFSLFNDTAVYFLTASAQTPALRYKNRQVDLSNLPAPENYVIQREEIVFNSNHLKRQLSKEITFSWFDGAGFCGNGNTQTNFKMSLPQLFTNGPEAHVIMRYACDRDSHRQVISINNIPRAEDEFDSWKIVERDIPVPAAEISTNPEIKIASALGGTDRHFIASVKIDYPRTPHFDGAWTANFTVPSTAFSGRKYLEIKNINLDGGPPPAYDLDHGARIQSVLENGLIKLDLPDNGVHHRLMMFNPKLALKTVGEMQAVQFRDFRPEHANYIIVSHPALQQPFDGQNQVEAYKEYRESAQGGGFKVAVINVEELYDQFAWGVRFHPLAVRNFLHYAEKHWPDPEHVLLIGKALEYTGFRTPADQSSYADSLFFIPTWCTPGADIPFTLDRNALVEPIMAIGRLAVTRPSEIRDYLEKVKEHERQLQIAPQTAAGKAWMKRVLHNSGGKPSETSAIRDYTSQMADEIRSNRFGAEVSAFYKTSNDPIQLSAYEQILDLVNGGVSIWSIFGHSSAAAVDFDIGTPDAYNNKGRYPFLLVMGCFSGLCSLTQQGLGEQFVLAKDKGAIAYVASVNYGFIDALHVYAQQYYKRIGRDDYRRSIGTALKNTVADLRHTTNPGLIAILHQNLLQGDPALRLNLSEGSDYLFDAPATAFQPNPVGLEQSEFELRFAVQNLGENKDKQLTIKVEQQLPDQTVLPRILDTVAAPGFRTEFSYRLPVAGSAAGYNRFLFTLDPGNNIAEVPGAEAEFNNEIKDASGEKGIEVYFFSDDVSPVYPPDYAIVRGDKVQLHASTLNAGAARQRYFFEIDTIELFNSPAKTSAQINARGGLVSWTPPLNLSSGKTYFWRVARDSLVNGAVVWRTRSFTRLEYGPPGWNQSHFGQFKQDTLNNIQALETERRLEFQNNAAFIDMTVAYRDVNRYPGIQNNFYDAFKGDYGLNQLGFNDGVIVSVSDPNTGHFILDSALLPTRRTTFQFNTRDSLERVRLMHFLSAKIPNGYYVGFLALSRPNDPIGYAPQRWAADSVTNGGKNLFNLLEAQGAREVRKTLQFSSGPKPYGICYRKNDPAYPALDTLAESPNDAIFLRANFLAQWTSGQFITPVIGPAQKWQGLKWSHRAPDHSGDGVRLSVIGVRPGLPDSTLAPELFPGEIPLQFIDPTRFPYLKLRYEALDTATNTLTTPDTLRVLYEGVPEGAIHPALAYQFHQKDLEKGDPLSVDLAFANISGATFDSLLVRYKIDNAAGTGIQTLRRYRKLPEGDTLMLRFNAPTASLEGPQRLLIDVNPDGDQRELHHFNNVLVQEFTVTRDRRNPLLEVTFDGRFIFDGDLVSPQPEILINLKDDNRFLPLSDSTAFHLTLESPDGQVRQIPANSPELLFFPADPTALPAKNKARLEWRPSFTLDGDYRLKVNARDASGNAASALDRTIRFRVITRSSLSRMVNYPNPFSTSTCFVYTLTGAEPPAHFRLRILTVSGKVVREVTETEFGPLQPGTHKSEFCWDGKDQYGDPLANGVYLYQISAKKADGTDFELFENETLEGYFKHGFGKMVLMR